MNASWWYKKLKYEIDCYRSVVGSQITRTGADRIVRSAPEAARMRQNLITDDTPHTVSEKIWTFYLICLIEIIILFIAFCGFFDKKYYLSSKLFESHNFQNNKKKLRYILRLDNAETKRHLPIV